MLLGASVISTRKPVFRKKMHRFINKRQYSCEMLIALAFSPLTGLQFLIATLTAQEKHCLCFWNNNNNGDNCPLAIFHNRRTVKVLLLFALG